MPELGPKNRMFKLNSPDWRLFLCLVVLGLLATWIPFFDLDEGDFLEATRELIDGGHWAATTLDGEPRYDKPILSYWFQAVAILSLDWLSPVVPIETIGRLPSVIAGAFWALVLGLQETASTFFFMDMSFSVVCIIFRLVRFCFHTPNN